MGKQTWESGSYCKSYSNDGETQDHRGGSEEDKVPEYEGNRWNGKWGYLEKISKIENALKKRVLAFKEKAPRYAGNPKGVCEKLESHLTRHDWQTIPDKGIKNMLLGCITGQEKVLLQQTGEGIVFDMYRLPEF